MNAFTSYQVEFENVTNMSLGSSNSYMTRRRHIKSRKIDKRDRDKEALRNEVRAAVNAFFLEGRVIKKLSDGKKYYASVDYVPKTSLFKGRGLSE